MASVPAQPRCRVCGHVVTQPNRAIDRGVRVNCPVCGQYEVSRALAADGIDQRAAPQQKRPQQCAQPSATP